MGNLCQVHWLGRVEYQEAQRLQKELVARRAVNEVPNTLLLLEHPPTYTIGNDGHREHLLINQNDLAQLKIALHRADRGGMVTFHGPGQLVCYPIVNLREYGHGYHRYLKMLESVIIRTLAAFGVRAFRERGQPGVWAFVHDSTPAFASWTQPDNYMAQIAAIGVKLNEQSITSHGFAINVSPNLDYFKHIVPCGIEGCRVTSLRQILNRPIQTEMLLEPAIQAFCEVFELQREAATTTVAAPAVEPAGMFA